MSLRVCDRSGRTFLQAPPESANQLFFCNFGVEDSNLFRERPPLEVPTSVDSSSLVDAAAPLSMAATSSRRFWSARAVLTAAVSFLKNGSWTATISGLPERQ